MLMLMSYYKRRVLQYLGLDSMGILNDLRARVQSVEDGLRTGEAVRNAVIRHGGDILELQRIQLLEGKRANGEDIRPYYTEDLKPSGYFYSVETAKRYAAWKESGINYPYSVQRNPDAPNLYINGRFHDEIDVEFGPDAVGVVPGTGYARQIMAKYGMNTFGLSPEHWGEVFERGAYFDLMQVIKNRLFYGN